MTQPLDRQSKRAAPTAKAQKLRAEGWTYEAIGLALGVSHATVWGWLNPDGRSAQRKRDNEKRYEAKRAWALENDRRPCVRCGALMGVGAHHSGSRHCATCRDIVRREGRMAKAREIERMWGAGATLPEIAAALQTTANTIGVEMARLRREGLADLPYRRNWKVAPNGN